MRFVTYLACATLVARAEIVEEDDDDLHFMRELGSHNMSNTTTMTPTTTTTTTTMKADSNVNTTTMTPNKEGNATDAPASAAASTAMPGGDSTAKPTDNVMKPPVRESAPSAESLAAKLANATADGEIDEGVLTVSITSTIKTKDTMGDAIAPFIVVEEATASGDAVQTANATAATPRRLAATLESLTKAHNLFCAAFGFAASYAACAAMPEEVQVGLFTSSGGTAAQGLANCVSGITLGSRHPMNTKNCFPSTATAVAADGVCFANALAVNNYDLGVAKTVKLSPETKACTVSNKGTEAAVGNATAPRVFDSSVSIEIPNWIVAASADIEISAADIAAATADAQTAVSSPAASAVLQAALIVAAVEIQTSVADADFNVTEALGIPEASWAEIVTAVQSSGDPQAFLTKAAADPASAGTAFTAAVAVVAENVVIENTSAMPSAGTSDASSLVLGLSMFISLLSLIF